MARIGSIIQETRLKKGINLDKVADETNISVRFLKKIEADDFTGFPGEPYVVGFIRNYAEYLGLEPEAIVARYRADEASLAENMQEELAAPPMPASGEEETPDSEPLKAEKPQKTAAGEANQQALPADDTGAAKKTRARKTAPKQKEAAAADTIQQAPAPNPEASLTHKAKTETLPPKALKSEFRIKPAAAEPKPGMKILVGVIILAVAAAGAAFLFRNRSNGSAALQQAPQEFRVEGSSFEKRIYPGDRLLIQTGSDVISVTLRAIEDTAVFETPQGAMQVSLGGNVTFDLNTDNYPEAVLTASDFEKGKPKNGVLVKVELPVPQTAANTGEITIPAGTAEAPQNQQPANSIIFKSPRGPYPFMATISFRGNCMLRYEADRKEWVEKYYQKGESVSVNVSSALILWASNAQAAKLTIQATGGKTYDHELGLPGEIVVKKISWAQQEGSWALMASNYE